MHLDTVVWAWITWHFLPCNPGRRCMQSKWVNSLIAWSNACGSSTTLMVKDEQANQLTWSPNPASCMQPWSRPMSTGWKAIYVIQGTRPWAAWGCATIAHALSGHWHIAGAGFRIYLSRLHVCAFCTSININQYINMSCKEMCGIL
jgi:hypothetical protein